MKKFVTYALCAVGSFTILYLFFSVERNRHAFSSKGSINSGAIFEVSIGEQRNVVEKFLGKNNFSKSDPSPMTIKGVVTQNHCYSKIIADNLTAVIYRDNSWRRGSLCVVYDEGRVVEVNWWYDMLAP